MTAIILITWRECFRRAFPWVAAIVLLCFVLTSRLFIGFAFGAAPSEAADLAVSAIFAAGLLHAALVGSRTVRADTERGTLALLLSKPTTLESYVAGRFIGLTLSAVAVACIVAAGTYLIFMVVPLPPSHSAPTDGATGPSIIAGALGRALLPIPILEAAAILLSASVPGFAAPIALIVLFAAGSLAGGGMAGFVLPDLASLGLEFMARPPLPPLIAYGALFSCFFLLLAYILLASRLPLRREA